MTGTPAPVRVLPQAFPDGVGCGVGVALAGTPAPGAGVLAAPEAAEQPALRPAAPRQSRTAGMTASRRPWAARLIITSGTSPVASGRGCLNDVPDPYPSALDAPRRPRRTAGLRLLPGTGLPGDRATPV